MATKKELKARLLGVIAEQAHAAHRVLSEGVWMTSAKVAKELGISESELPEALGITRIFNMLTKTSAAAGKIEHIANETRGKIKKSREKPEKEYTVEEAKELAKKAGGMALIRSGKPVVSPVTNKPIIVR